MAAALVEHGAQRGIGADAVVVPVGADEGAVETDVARGIGGNGGELCGEEVFFADAVLFAQDGEHGQLELFIHLFVGVGHAPHHDVELLALDDLAARLCHLLAAEMREKVVDIEHGVGGVFADADLCLRAVFAHDDAVQRQRHRRPLVLFDAAVIMRFEEAHARLFVEGVLLDVDAGRVDVRDDEAHAVFFEVFAADAEGDDALAAVDEVALVSRAERVAEFIFGKASPFGETHGGGAGFALGFRLVEECLVLLREGEHRLLLLFGCRFEVVLFVVGELFVQLLTLALFFCHRKTPLPRAGRMLFSVGRRRENSPARHILL